MKTWLRVTFRDSCLSKRKPLISSSSFEDYTFHGILFYLGFSNYVLGHTQKLKITKVKIDTLATLNNFCIKVSNGKSK